MARRLGIDPAVVSAPLISTLVDATGLVIFYTVAIVALDQARRALVSGQWSVVRCQLSVRRLCLGNGGPTTAKADINLRIRGKA